MEVIDISIRTITISSIASLLASTWSLPLSYALSGSKSRYSIAVREFFNATIGIPTVLIGLMVYLAFSRSGPLGYLNILYTPQAIILGQSILVTPLLVVLFTDIFREYRSRYWELALTLGATEKQAALIIVRKAKFNMITAYLLSFARAVGELGIALLVGGNIKGYTRVLSTAIALEIERGRFEDAFTLGLILLLIVVLINITVRILWRRIR
jgi:tungstate transport system permease protein